jgi:hypothetical protein
MDRLSTLLSQWEARLRQWAGEGRCQLELDRLRRFVRTQFHGWNRASGQFWFGLSQPFNPFVGRAMAPHDAF